MAVKSVVSVEVNDVSFREFMRLYAKYETALKKAPTTWALVNKNIDGSKESFDKLVGQMSAANVQAQLRVKAQEQADRLTKSSAERWQSMARSTREFARNIGDATTALLRWSAISGLVGAGGLFGLDRLGLAAAGSRRSALGLGASIGGQEAFKANFGRLVDPEAFLSNVAGAKFDVTKRVGLISGGLSSQQIGGDTAQTAVALLRNLKKIADETTPALYAQVLQARRLDQFASPTDLERLRNTSPAEFSRLEGQYGKRRSQFDLDPNVAERWQDFVTQLGNAGKSIETVLVKGLVSLTPGLGKLSEAVEKFFGVLLEKGGPLERWITAAGAGIEKFAGYIGKPEFEKDVKSFIDSVGRMADAVGRVVGFLGSPPVKAAGGALSVVGTAAKTTMDIGADLLSGNINLMGHGQMTPDQLLGIVRKSEASGDKAVSPKGALGRYQIMPATGAEMGFSREDLLDPTKNEAAARKYLGMLIRKYHGNTERILAAYNSGPGAEDKFDRGLVRTRPAETQKYLDRAQGMKGYAPTVVTINDNTGGNVNVSINGLKD